MKYLIPIFFFLITSRISVNGNCDYNGILVGDTSVCKGENEGNLRIKKLPVDVIQWQYTTDTVWYETGNTSLVQNFEKLTNTTKFRAYVKNGECAADFTNIVTVTVDDPTAGGIVVNDTVICKGQNSGILKLINSKGNVISWQYNTEDDIVWRILNNTDNFCSFQKLQTTTNCRAEVKNGACASVFSKKATIKVNPVPKPFFTVFDTCENNTVRISNLTIQSPGMKFEWDFGDGDQISNEITPDKEYEKPGKYSIKLKAITADNCSAIDSSHVIVYAIPKVDFDYFPNNICEGTEVIFSTDLKQDLLYSWKFGDDSSSVLINPKHTYNLARTYEVKLSVASFLGHCSASISKFVKVHPLPKIITSGDTSISLGYETQLTAEGGISYNWLPVTGLSNPEIANPIASPDVTTTYKLRVEDEYQCVNDELLTVTVINDYKLEPSNIITPDNNGENDTWNIKNIEKYGDATVMIFNRFGEELYYAKNYSNNWDGRNKNNDILPDGTYFYVIKFSKSNTLYKGSITLIRKK